MHSSHEKSPLYLDPTIIFIHFHFKVWLAERHSQSHN